MYQCIILNVPLWNDWSKVTYLQVHGSSALSFKSSNWISATIFAELIIQFGQDPKVRQARTFWRENVFYWHFYLCLSYVKLSRCPEFCSKNIQILLIHSNSRWTKGNVVATDFHVFSVIFEMPRISCSIFWDLQKYFSKSNKKVKEKKLTKFSICWLQYQLNFI